MIGRCPHGPLKENKKEIMSTATSTEIPDHKTNEKKNPSKQLSKEAIMRQGKLREITKCLL